MAATTDEKNIVRVTKGAAALMQLEAAILHFRDGQWIPAITLAGAAEGMLPDHQRSLFRMMVDGAVRLKLRPKGSSGEYTDRQREREMATISNRSRDWLKHTTPPDRDSFGDVDAVMMIIRAITKYNAHHGSNSQTVAWFIEHVRKAYPWIVNGPAHPASEER